MFTGINFELLRLRYGFESRIGYGKPQPCRNDIKEIDNRYITNRISSLLHDDVSLPYKLSQYR